MTLIEWIILYICGAIGMQRFTNTMKVVEWKRFFGVLLWPLVVVYVIGKSTWLYLKGLF